MVRDDAGPDSAPPEVGAQNGGPDAAPVLPREIPSRQKVIFVLRNESSADRYVVTAGHRCDPFSIARVGDGGFDPLPLSFDLGVRFIDDGPQTCEGTSQGAPRPATLRRLRAGESLRMEWDARALVTVKTQIACALPAGRTAEILAGALQPVTSGAYQVAVATYASIPGHVGPPPFAYTCAAMPPTSNELTCSGNPSGFNGNVVIQMICPADRAPPVRFDLPPSGDLVVPLALN